VTLLGGEPGIGKSTLLLQVLSNITSRGSSALMISAEESPSQVRHRSERMGTLESGLRITSQTSLPAVLAAITASAPEVVVLDSIQAICDPERNGAPGRPTQVKECAGRLARLAKSPACTVGGRQPGPAVVLVGHVTKEGPIAGPRALEHLVDTVLSFEGERHNSLRLLRSSKHRFGPSGELGLFEMTQAGLMGVADPSHLLLADRRSGSPGGAVVLPWKAGVRSW
jgi:DNA repair protein RadA/Sms